MRDETRLAQAGIPTDDPWGAVSAPIYQSSTFRHPGAGQSTGYDYSRTDNPTRHGLEQAMAELEHAAGACAFSSGMAALSAVFFLFRPGDTLLVSEDLYGGTWRLLEEVFRPWGLEARFVDTTSLREVESAGEDPRIKGILIETPSNPGMRISDLPSLLELARRRNWLSIVDNTFLTPLRQKPLDLGADIVVHSGTKYLAGHNDAVCGFALAARTELVERIRFQQNSSGAILAPMESWLVLRGLKTLAVRMERQEANAQKLAEWLVQQPAIESVYFPGLVGHPGKDLHDRQATGPGAMISFRTKTPGMALQVIDRVRLISYAESLGGVESLVTYPLTQTHAAIPEALRLKTGVTDTLLRLSVGIEAWEDLRDDLGGALA